MKSVKISRKGEMLLQIIHKKSGEYVIDKLTSLTGLDIEVRDDENNIVYFPVDKKK